MARVRERGSGGGDGDGGSTPAYVERTTQQHHRQKRSSSIRDDGSERARLGSLYRVPIACISSLSLSLLVSSFRVWTCLIRPISPWMPTACDTMDIMISQEHITPDSPSSSITCSCRRRRRCCFCESRCANRASAPLFEKCLSST